MPSQSLIVLDGWKAPTIAGEAVQARAELIANLELLDAPIKSQVAAEAAAEAIAEAKRWENDLEAASKACREPFFNHAKKIKATTDEFQLPEITAQKRVQNRLAEWEAEKLQAQRNLERQAREEAERLRRQEEERQRQARMERERQEAEARRRQEEIEAQQRAAASKAEQERLARQAAELKRQAEEAAAKRAQEEAAERARLAAIAPTPVAWEPPKTEGVNAGVVVEFDVTDQRRFAEWCWEHHRDEWIRDIAFDKRAIMAWASKLPDDAPLPRVPGLDLRRVASVAVRPKAKRRVYDVPSDRVEIQ